MTTTITIYNPDGTSLRTLQDPITWSFTDNNVFHVTIKQRPGGPDLIISTTLPVLIERSSV
jgi:hypothetical protein